MKKLSIIKVGGKIVEEADTLQQLINDFSAIAGPKILVHGGGRSATAIAGKLGVETKMVDGRRITDAEMLNVVTMVYGGTVNKNIVARCQANGMNAVGLTGADLNIIRAEKRQVEDVDYGFVGDVVSVQSKQLSNLLKLNIVPVIAPLTHDGKGQLLNTNADTMAAAVAKALAKDFKCTLVYCFEKPGVLIDQDDDDSVIRVLEHSTCNELKKNGTINSGMIPKLDNGFDALKMGVAKVVITNSSALNDIDGKGTHLKI